jgi:hypothetical protein
MLSVLWCLLPGGRSRVAKAAIPGGPYFKPEELTQVCVQQSCKTMLWHSVHYGAIVTGPAMHSRRKTYLPPDFV